MTGPQISDPQKILEKAMTDYQKRMNPSVVTRGYLMQQSLLSLVKRASKQQLNLLKLRLRSWKLSYYLVVLWVGTRLIKIGTILGMVIQKKMEKDMQLHPLNEEIQKILSFRK